MNLRTIIKCIFVILCLTRAYASISQPPGTYNDATPQDKLTAPASDKDYSFLSLFNGKPGRAALCGLIVPSGGQIYNKKYIKAGIFLAIEGTIIYFAIDRTQKYNILQQGYLDVLNGRKPDHEGVRSAATLRTARNNARKDKDYLWIGFGIGHFLAIAESFVDRHLMDFDVSDDLSFRIMPPATNGSVVKLLSFQYKLSSK